LNSRSLFCGSCTPVEVHPNQAGALWFDTTQHRASLFTKELPPAPSWSILPPHPLPPAHHAALMPCALMPFKETRPPFACLQDALHHPLVHPRELHHRVDGDAARLLLAERDVGRAAVQPHAHLQKHKWCQRQHMHECWKLMQFDEPCDVGRAGVHTMARMVAATKPHLSLPNNKPLVVDPKRGFRSGSAACPPFSSSRTHIALTQTPFVSAYSPLPALVSGSPGGSAACPHPAPSAAGRPTCTPR